MSRTVILGAGISGHTAALHLKRMLGRRHEVIVVSPNSHWNWIPSNIWVGTGRVGPEKVVFPLAPVYARKRIDFRQAAAVALFPEGTAEDATPCVEIEYTADARRGERDRITYDFLINATGPRLNFGATPGLGPDGGNSASVCTAAHAADAAAGFREAVEKMRAGEEQTLVVGMGHGTCTCEGAAFEYVFNVDNELREAGVRDKAEIVYLTNEAELGDFGVGGMQFTERGYLTSSRLWTESLFRERGIRAITGAHVEAVEPGRIRYETLDGSHHTLDFDYAMLLPPFTGVPLEAWDAGGADIRERLFAPNGMMKVDARYGVTDPTAWSASDWPETYMSPAYPNIFAVGIAFAPPHAISTPRTTPNGTLIAPAPPRTGMPSGVMGRQAARSIADRVRKGPDAAPHVASMARMGAACVASTGAGLTRGSAASMVMHPVVPDRDAHPETGRSKHTVGEIGLAGHWVKLMLHHLFLYKAKAKPFWYLIPE